MPISFWKKLKKRQVPILALAPMAGFTDSIFRQIVKRYGADVVYSEMASATAIFYNQKKDSPTFRLLKFDRAKEKYYVVQLFGSNPEHLAAAARFITKYIKPDGLDLNFGCPVPKIIKQGAGSGLMKDLKKSRAALEAVLHNTDLPVSIKIRAKAGEVGALEFLKNISDLPVEAVMIHGRTLSQGFAGAPDLKIIKDARRYFKGVILANGGIDDLAEAKRVLRVSRADGLGLARGVLGRPWLFKEIKTGRTIDMEPSQIYKLVASHAAAVEKKKGKPGIIELRKHLVWYMLGLDGASKKREKLVKAESLADVKKAFC